MLLNNFFFEFETSLISVITSQYCRGEEEEEQDNLNSKSSTKETTATEAAATSDCTAIAEQEEEKRVDVAQQNEGVDAQAKEKEKEEEEVDESSIKSQSRVTWKSLEQKWKRFNFDVMSKVTCDLAEGHQLMLPLSRWFIVEERSSMPSHSQGSHATSSSRRCKIYSLTLKEKYCR